MAQITLNLKSNSESFATNDADILYVTNLYSEGDIVGSILTIIDTASAVTTTIDVEETITDIKELSTALVEIDTTQNESPLINIGRIKDIYTYGDVANIRYDDNGNVFSVIKTTMTTAEILQAIQDVNPTPVVPMVYTALATQSGTDEPTVVILGNTLGFVPTFGYSDEGEFTVISDGGFTVGKTIFTGNQVLNSTDTVAYESNYDDSELYITSLNSGTPTNDLLSSTYIYIEVKP